MLHQYNQFFKHDWTEKTHLQKNSSELQKINIFAYFRVEPARVFLFLFVF